MHAFLGVTVHCFFRGVPESHRLANQLFKGDSLETGAQKLQSDYTEESSDADGSETDDKTLSRHARNAPG